MLQAADYSAVTFYLNAVKATGSDDTDTVMKWMKSNKINDFFATNGYVREDGRMVHDMFLMQVKHLPSPKGHGTTTKSLRHCQATKSMQALLSQHARLLRNKFRAAKFPAYGWKLVLTPQTLSD